MQAPQESSSCPVGGKSCLKLALIIHRKTGILRLIKVTDFIIDLMSYCRKQKRAKTALVFKQSSVIAHKENILFISLAANELVKQQLQTPALPLDSSADFTQKDKIDCNC